MAAWDELKVVLVRLREEQPGVLLGSPTLELDPGRVPPVPPFRIYLAPWAAATAAELRRQFGDDVELTVGALPYPPGARPRPRLATAPLPGLLDSREVTVELDGPAVVRSGHTLRHSLLVRNLSGSELQIATNGQVTAAVVDPHTGEVVGGYSGPQPAPLKVFRGGPGRKHAGAPADRYGQHDAPARVHGPGGGMGHPGDAYARRSSPRLASSAHTDPASDGHRLSGRIDALRWTPG